MSTSTLPAPIADYKGRISEAFEAEGYTVTNIIVGGDNEEGEYTLDYYLEDRESDEIPAVRIWIYEDDLPGSDNYEYAQYFEEIDPDFDEDDETFDPTVPSGDLPVAFRPDFIEFAPDGNGTPDRDPEQMRELQEIFTKHFEEGVDFDWMD